MADCGWWRREIRRSLQAVQHPNAIRCGILEVVEKRHVSSKSVGKRAVLREWGSVGFYVKRWPALRLSAAGHSTQERDRVVGNSYVTLKDVVLGKRNAHLD